MHIVEKRNLWFTISLLAVLPGIFYMVWSVFATGSPLPLSIDFTGGTVWDIRLAADGGARRRAPGLRGCRTW